MNSKITGLTYGDRKFLRRKEADLLDKKDHTK